VLELLLAAPAWRADRSNTAAMVAAAMQKATPYQQQWQGDPGNNGLTFFHSSIFCILPSTLLYTSL